jgi:hypothetical protein
MQTKETKIRYDIVRVGGGGPCSRYDIVRHTPGEVDEILARATNFNIAAEIVKALNAECGA